MGSAVFIFYEFTYTIICAIIAIWDGRNEYHNEQAGKEIFIEMRQ